jgi:hypothetical protein
MATIKTELAKKADAAQMDERFEAMDQRFESVDRRFEAMDRRFDSMDAELAKKADAKEMRDGFDTVDKRLDELKDTLEDTPQVVLNGIHDERTAHDEKIEGWIGQLATATGTQLSPRL